MSSSTEMRTSPSPRPKKKAKADAAAAPAAAEDRDTSPFNLTIELIGRVATFGTYLVHGNDVLNICLAVGPKQSKIIRKEVLRDNCHYLAFSLFKCISVRGSKARCKHNYKAWMESNPDWKKLVTPAAMLRNFNVVTGPNEAALLPLSPFCNPAVAAEIGLVEALKFLIEEKGIGVNDYHWTSYVKSPPSHVLVRAMEAEDTECFDYLLSRDDLDITAFGVPEDESRLLHAAIMCTSSKHPYFLSTIAQHPRVDVNDIVSFEEGEGATALILLVSMGRSFNMPDQVWMEKFEILLKAGSNIHLETEMFASPNDALLNQLEKAIGGEAEKYQKALALIKKMGLAERPPTA